MSTRRLKAVLITATGLAFFSPVMADTATTTFQVTATVNDSCTVAATDLAFGSYDAGAGNLDATSTITATCTAGTAYDIGLDAGSNGASAAGTTRAMVDGGGTAYLDYELYSDAARSNVWGETIGTDTLNVPSAAGGDEDHTVYGRVPAGQYGAEAGGYSDTINVTVTF